MHARGLTWILVDGEPAHVSRFAGLPPRRRPPVFCPQCGRRLTLKLGPILRHHAAHAAHDRCAATAPETALHLDVKHHLAASLRAAIGTGAPLVLRRQCADVCDVTELHTWLRDWDDVVVETTVAGGRARPDITLVRDGRPVAAIEVLVSHAVDEEKQRALAGVGVPWIEVRAAEALLGEEDAGGWTADLPLPVAREGTADRWGAWRCAAHEREHRVRIEALAERQARDAEAARRRSELRAARVVDVYQPGGARDRLIYRVEEVRLDGAVAALVLRRGTREIASAPTDDARESKRAAWSSLQRAYAADVERLTAAPGTFADSPMHWATGDAAENLVYEALADMVPGDPTPLVTRFPRRWYFARERGEWFLPRDMRAVHWDRPDRDAFAPHAAWRATRTVVRERPVPDDAWRGVAFASRPNALSFAGKARPDEQGPIAMIAVGGGTGAHGVRRAVVVLTGPADDADVRRVAEALASERVEAVWLSHPMDWRPAMADLSWAAAGRDERGRGVVVVDGVGVYRADAFVRAIERGDRRLSPAAIRAASASRMAGLASRSQGPGS